ncbi:MAG: hypothetical protein NW237_14795 [Cyanobacteriota bacterium]|nr:hypothetical protein [Cyanobacteriota bacterium]
MAPIHDGIDGIPRWLGHDRLSQPEVMAAESGSQDPDSSDDKTLR